MKDKADIVVVGGGPCGSYSALVAASGGAEVLVVEEHTDVGFPSHCAGHISIHGLESLEIGVPSHIIENRIKTATFFSPSGKMLRIECEDPVTYVINRALFDRYLAELAEHAGVSYLTGVRAKSFLIDSGRVRGVSLGEERESLVEAKVVIDAEGVNAALLRKANLPYPMERIVTGVQGYSERVSGVEPESVEVYLGRRYAPGFFAWIIPRKDGSAKVGLASNRGNPKVLLERFIADHPIASRKISKSLSSVSIHPISLGGPLRKTYSEGLIIVGDAASQVKPTTGGGVIFGLMCSRAAGETAANSVAAGDYSSRALSEYEKSWKRLLGREFMIGRATRKILSSLSDAAVDRIFQVAKGFNVENSIGSVSEVDFEERILQYCLRKPNVAIALICSLLSCLLP